ncbi:MAG: hypothetical protein V1827_01160 [Candidatus Micrarchaeota archaeon]
MVTLAHSPRPDRCQMTGRFGKYLPEADSPVRRLNIEETKGVNRLLELWKAVESMPYSRGSQDHWSLGRFISVYRDFLRHAESLDYSNADVTALSALIHALAPEHLQRLEASAFLTAIIEASKETDHLLVLKNADGDFPFLGYENRKNVTIIGDVDSTGYEMRSGSITVQGWGGDVGTHMKGGIIVVDGDCDGIGSQMSGGEVHIKGSVRPGPKTSGSYCGIGFDTYGCRIVVDGDCPAVMNVSGGDITIGGNVVDVGMRNHSAIIRIAGNVTGEIGRWMSGGEIHIGGSMGPISDEIHRGKVFQKGKLIYGGDRG